MPPQGGIPGERPVIVRSQPSLRDILFAVNGSILPRIWPRLLAIALVSIASVLVAKRHPGIFEAIGAIPFTLIGISLSVFMSFRNNTCYVRWWEGRQLWGELIVACRSFARQISTLPEEDRRALAYGVCGFCAGLSARLRGTDEAEAIRQWCPAGSAACDPNPTNTVLTGVGRRCLSLMQAGRLDPIHYSVLETQLTKLAQVQGGCERIAGTPVPFAYSLLLQRTAIVFCLTLPFALAGSLGWWTLLPVLLVAYTFFGLDALGHQLENPFGFAPNSLPLSAMRRTIEREMLGALEGEDVPPPLEPENGVLL